MGKKKKKQQLQQQKQSKRAATQDKESAGAIVQSAEFHQGPLPHPGQLEHYEKILPGLADRIVTMAEGQTEHRQKLEKKVITFDGIKSYLGLIFAFLIVIAGIAGSIFLAVNDKPVEGWLVGLAPLVTVVGAFIYQRKGVKK